MRVFKDDVGNEIRTERFLTQSIFIVFLSSNGVWIDFVENRRIVFI